MSFVAGGLAFMAVYNYWPWGRAMSWSFQSPGGDQYEAVAVPTGNPRMGAVDQRIPVEMPPTLECDALYDLPDCPDGGWLSIINKTSGSEELWINDVRVAIVEPESIWPNGITYKLPRGRYDVRMGTSSLMCAVASGEARTYHFVRKDSGRLPTSPAWTFDPKTFQLMPKYQPRRS
jgi:hypothetical protein